jgi:hypothetical protein
VLEIECALMIVLSGLPEARVNLAEHARRCHLWAGFRTQIAQIERILTDNFGCDIQHCTDDTILAEASRCKPIRPPA